MHPRHKVGPNVPLSMPHSSAINDPQQVMGFEHVELGPHQLPSFKFPLDDDAALDCAYESASEIFYDAREEIYMSALQGDNSEDGYSGGIISMSDMTGWDTNRESNKSVASYMDAKRDRPVVETQVEEVMTKEPFSPTALSGQHTSERSDSLESVAFFDAVEHHQPIFEGQFEKNHTEFTVKPCIEASNNPQSATKPSTHVDSSKLGYTRTSTPPSNDSGSFSIENDPFILQESLSSPPITIIPQPVGAGTMSRHKKPSPVTRPQYSPFQSALKSPVLVKTPRIVKKVSFSFDGVVEKNPRSDVNDSPSNNGHKTNKSPASSSDQGLFIPRKSFQRHRRMSGWTPTLPSPLGLGPALTSTNSDASTTVGTIRFPKMSRSLPSTPKRSNHANDRFTTPETKLPNSHPQAGLFSQTGSRVYTADRNDPFAEREYISSPTAEAVTSAYASERPRDFQQYLGYEPLADPFGDIDFPTAQMSASSRSQSLTPTPTQTSLQSLQSFSANDILPGPTISQMQGGGLPYNLVGIGSQFARDQQFTGSAQSLFGPDLANIPGSIPNSPFESNFPIPQPPFCHIPQTSPNRARLNSRKQKRKSWIQTEAHNIFLARENIEDTRIQFLNSGLQEDLDKWEAAEEEFKKLTSMDYQIGNRRRMFMNRGVEPLRMGEGNVWGDGFRGEGQEGALVAFEMALMERIGVEATRRGNRGFGAGADVDVDVEVDADVGVNVDIFADGLPEEKNTKGKRLTKLDAINTPKYPPTLKKQSREHDGHGRGQEAPANGFA